jgi:hypothetical protein
MQASSMEDLMRVMDSFPKDIFWCEAFPQEEPVVNSSMEVEVIESSGSREPESLHSIRTKLKKQSRRLRTERKIWKKIEKILEDQASKLDVEHVLLKGLSMSLPRQQFQDYLMDS